MVTHGERAEPRPYDALLYLSFGGPEGAEDVLPFLENVTRGRDVPRARLLEVAAHYELFGGVSPINAQNRAVIAALREFLDRDGPDLPVYWGNRNWRPFAADAVRQMAADGVRRAVAFATAAFSSYSSCRQYLDDIAAAREAVGPDAPEIDKIRPFHDHPGFIEPQAGRARTALHAVPESRRADARLLFTAHSIPVAMADASDYVAQLTEACGLVAERVDASLDWELAYQSRSGPPHVPWLEPDVNDRLRALAGEGVTDVVVVPIGFVSDHLEVQFDLDVEAAATAAEVGLHLVRAGTVGAHPRYVAMIRELVLERTDPAAPRLALGSGPVHDACAPDCCRPAP